MHLSWLELRKLKGRVLLNTNPQSGDYGHIGVVKRVTKTVIHIGVDDHSYISRPLQSFYENKQRDWELVKEDELPLLIGKKEFLNEAIGEILKGCV